MFGERVSWSCPCHVPTLMIKVSCNQRVFIAVSPRGIALHMQSTCGKCVSTYWHALLICTIHIIDAYSSKTKEHASLINIYIYTYTYIYICTLNMATAAF